MGVPLGTTRDIAPLGLQFPCGTPAVNGGPVTAGGLVFIGAAMDDYLRAFDAKAGAELWKGRLPGRRRQPHDLRGKGRHTW